MRFMMSARGLAIMVSMCATCGKNLAQPVRLQQQDVFLFDGSLRDNIAYGSRESTDEEIIAAAKNANAWEFIEPLEKGLDTVVGERGKTIWRSTSAHC